MAIVTNTDKITALYVGYFNRAPDPDGLSFWVGQANAGVSINTIANLFATAPEAISAYAFLAAPNIGGALAAQDFITHIYENLFNREPDAGGLAFWTGKLVSGQIPPGLMITTIINAAQPPDAAIMNNKVTVGEVYANAFVSENVPWNGIDDLASAKAALAGGAVFGANFVQVTADASTVAGNSAKALQLALALHNNSEAITLTPNHSSILDGGGVDILVNAVPSLAGKSLQYSLTGLTSSEVVGGALGGTIILDSTGNATIHVGTIVQTVNGADETLTVAIPGPGAIGPLPVNVTVTHGTQTLGAGPNPVNEGSTFNIAVLTTGVAAGSVTGRTETYTITGPGLAQIPVADQSGTVTLDALGNAVVTIHTLANVFNSATDTSVTVTLTGIPTVPPVFVTIHEAATQTVTPVPSPVTEGHSVVFNIATGGLVSNAPVAGTVETWTLTGDSFVLGQIAGGVLSGNVTLDSNGTAAVTVGTTFTVFNPPNPDETLTFNLFNNNTPVISKNVTVHEATVDVSAPVDNVVEGQTVTYTINLGNITAADVPNGTSFHYTLSGAALHNVLGATSGTVVMNGLTGLVVVQTISNDTSGTLGEELTLTLDNVPDASATAFIDETAPLSFILTTGTDTGAKFTGNAAGDNTYIAVASSNAAFPTTLGQNDNLDGNSNVPGHPNTLFLNTTGTSTLNVNSFSTKAIQIFEINAANSSSNGTRMDMSSVFGADTITDRNSSGSLQLLNLQNKVVLNIFDPTDLGNKVNVGLQYVSGQLANVNANGGQVINLDPTVSPITGMPNTAINAPGVYNFTINSLNVTDPGNSAVFNGLVSVNQPLKFASAPFNTSPDLAKIVMMGDTAFVLGGFESDVVGANFTDAHSKGVFSSTLNLSQFHNTFYDVGDPEEDPSSFTPITYDGGNTFHIIGGDGGPGPALQAYYYNPNGSLGAQNGGSGAGTDFATIWSTDGNVEANIGTALFLGQGIHTSGHFDTVFVHGTTSSNNSGYVDDQINAATIKTYSGSVTVQDLGGGLGSVNFQNNPNSFILTNTSTSDGGHVLVQNVNGGIDVQISSGSAQAQILEGSNTGDMIVDFSQTDELGPNTGFHGSDQYFGGSGTNTLVMDPTINNNTSTFGEGSASGLKNLILQSDPVWNPDTPNTGTGSPPTNSVGLATLGNTVAHPIDVYIGGEGNTANLAFPINEFGLTICSATFTGTVTNENFFVDTFSTGALHGQIFDFDFANTSGNTLNFTVQNFDDQDQALTIRDFAVTKGGNDNPIQRLNFTSTASDGDETTTLTIDLLNSLQQLYLIGTAALHLDDVKGQAASINLIDGTGDNSNTDITGLMTALDTQNQTVGPPSGTLYTNPGHGAADALAPNGGTIHLGNGANKIAVAGGSWTITSDGFGTTILVNPNSGDADIIHATGGGVVITDGANDGKGGVGGGGQVDITTDHGGNLFVFDQQGLPQFTSSNRIQAGNGGFGNDKILIINGPLAIFDAGFTQVTGVEQLQVAEHFSNHIEMNFNFDNNAATNQTGKFEIITGGGGFLDSSTFVNAGAGYNHPLLVTVGALLGGDAGGDTVTTHKSTTPGSNPLTVHGNSNDLDVSFLSSKTTIQGDPEGIFATTTAQNTLEVVADNGTLSAFGAGTYGINGVQSIIGKQSSNNNLSIWLVNDGVAAGSPEKVDLTAVTGNTVVLGSALTKALNIDGGSGNGSKTNSLFGSTANDTITGHGQGTNDFYGGKGSDTLTSNGANGAVDIFVYNALSDSQGGQVPTDADNIVNFHPSNDKFSVNPLTLFGGAITFVGPTGGAASYADALTYLNPLILTAQAVLINTGGSTGQLWIDANADGNLNAADYEFNMTFASPPFLNGSNFTTVAPATTQFTASGPLLYVADTFQTTIPAWNIAPPPAVITTVQFIGLGGDVLADPPNFTNYDFSKVLSGISFTTPEFNGDPPVMPPGKVTGSAFDDKFFLNNLDGANGFIVDGGLGIDQITFDPPGPLVFTISSTGFGPGKGQVDHVETLNLIDTLGNDITFEGNTASGNDFKNINGDSGITGPNVIENLFATGGSQNFNAGGLIDLSKDKGADVVNLGTDLAGSTILLDGLGTVMVNYGGALTTTITGLHNVDKVVLDAGNVAHDLSGAVITDVTELDMTAQTSAIVTLSTAEVGGLKGFTKIDMDKGGGAHIVLAPGGNPVAADFTNVTLNTLKFKLGVGADDTVKLLHTQIPLQGIDGGGPTDKFIITDNGDFSLEGAKYNNLGSVSWQTGELTIDNTAVGLPGQPHGISEVHGNGSSSLEVEDSGSTDISGITIWDGITRVVTDLGGGKTLTVNSDQAVSVGHTGPTQDFHAEFPATNQNLTINALGDYDVGNLALTNDYFLTVAVSSWKAIDFDGQDKGGVTVSTTDWMFDLSLNKTTAGGVSTITDVHGDSVGSPTDVLNVSLQSSGTDTLVDLHAITKFDGFHDVHVIEPFNDLIPDTFHVNDVISSYTFLHGGTSTLDLNNNGGDVAWLQTSTLSAQTSKTSTGFNTDWDITGFNAGINPNASVLKITDINSGNGGTSTNDLHGSLFINSSSGVPSLDHTKMNVINTNVATSTNLLDLSDNGNVEFALASVAGLTSDGRGLGQNAANTNAHVYAILQGSGAFQGEAGVYEINMDTTATHLVAGATLKGHEGDFSVNLIGIIHVPGDSLQNANFNP